MPQTRLQAVQERRNRSAERQISDLREEIDQIDEELLRLLHERTRVAIQIGREKRSAGLPIRDEAREAQVIGRAVLQASQLGGDLDEGVLVEVMQGVLKISRRAQHREEMG